MWGRFPAWERGTILTQVKSSNALIDSLIFSRMLADTKTKNGIGYEMHFSSVQYTINSSQKRKSVGKTLISLYNESLSIVYLHPG